MFRAAVRSFLPVLAGLTVLAWPGSSEAGFVFMKNGYIIQGRVVERDNEKIVLRWLDGTMTIEHRFISELVLDSGEKRELEIRASIERAVVQPGVQAPDVVEVEVPLRLPENIEEIMSLHGYNWGADGGSKSGVVNVQPIEPSVADPPFGNDSIPAIDPIGPSEIRFEQAQCALTPPPGWEVVEEAGMIRVHKPGDARRTALSIQFQMDAPVEEDVARAELQEALARNYPGIEGLVQEDATVGSQPALRVAGAYPARGLRFSEFLVRWDDTYYLIALLEPEKSNHEDALLLQAMVDSLRFLPQ